MLMRDIKVGETYCNKGKGTTMRRVVKLDKDSVYCHIQAYTKVIYINLQDGCQYWAWLDTFAKWAGSRVAEPVGSGQ